MFHYADLVQFGIKIIIVDNGCILFMMYVNNFCSVRLHYIQDPKMIPANFRLLYKESKMLVDWKEIELYGTERSYTISGLDAWQSFDVLVNVTSKGGRTNISNVLPVLVIGSSMLHFLLQILNSAPFSEINSLHLE